MDGRARAPAAATVLNALATGTGSAFAIDVYTTAEVTLTDSNEITGEIAGEPGTDTTLIERCVELTVAEYGSAEWSGGHVRTESEIPIASGLKSSSAAANATVLATLDALGLTDEVDRIDATRLGVRAAREVGVTVTGAFDDASASMLGGVTITDNTNDRLRSQEPFDFDVLVWTPPEQSFSADADVSRCRRVAQTAAVVAELAKAGRYGEAMTINGFAFSAALSMPTEPMIEALSDVAGVSVSGTGPSVVAIGEAADLETVRTRWESREGTTWITTTQNEGARTT